MIQTQIKQSVAWLKIDRPKHKNALSIKLLEEILITLNEFDTDKNIRIIIIYGNDNFSSGGDLNDMIVNNTSEAQRLASKVQKIYLEIENITKPIIAYTKGYVFGGGFELALVCDFIISHSNSKFALPEATLGIIPGGGATQRLKTRIGKQNAAYILLSGKELSAQEMLSLNLIQEISDDINQVNSIANSIANKNHNAIKELKYLLKKDMDFSAETLSFAKLLISEGQKEIQGFTNSRKEAKK